MSSLGQSLTWLPVWPVDATTGSATCDCYGLAPLRATMSVCFLLLWPTLLALFIWYTTLAASSERAWEQTQGAGSGECVWTRHKFTGVDSEPCRSLVLLSPWRKRERARQKERYGGRERKILGNRKILHNTFSTVTH